jgi:hypothetical protein
MVVTAEIFEAFLKCRTKSYLFGSGVAVEETAIAVVQAQLENVFRRDAGTALRATAADYQLYVGTPPIEETFV